MESAAKYEVSRKYPTSTSQQLHKCKALNDRVFPHLSYRALVECKGHVFLHKCITITQNY